LKDFSVRAYAPDVPLLANIGAAQLKEYPPLRVMETARRLEADALVVHLNPGQEIVQEGGTCDFRRVLDDIAALADTGALPVIVKETGFGIRPRRVRELLARGVHLVDIAGAGGTDFLQVELACRREADPPLSQDFLAETFASWGLPTALILAGMQPASHTREERALPLIASGGLKSGLDLAKALALGAVLGGMALPFLRAYTSGGEEGMHRFMARLRQELTIAMFMTGSRTLSALRKAALRMDADFAFEAERLHALES
jgi:isopentenyl-diphosphate delta-isomerase type 2